jgi:hypothetical protein
VSLGLASGRWCAVVIGIVDVRVIVEFRMGFGEWALGDSGEKFFEGHASKSDFGIGQGSVGIAIGIGFGFSFGFLNFAEFEEFFGDAHFGHEFGDFGPRAVHEAGIFFKLVELFGSKATTPIGEEFFLDIGAFGPFPEIFFFFVGGVGLAEGEPVALDLEVIVGECGTAEARNVGCKLAEGGPFAFRIGFGVDVVGHGDVLELGPEEEFVGELECGMADIIGGLGIVGERPLTPGPLPIGW